MKTAKILKMIKQILKIKICHLKELSSSQQNKNAPIMKKADHNKNSQLQMIQK